MAKDRISSKRSSFSANPRGDAGVDEKSAGTLPDGLAGSSPDSGSKPGSEFDGVASDVGRAGSSISPMLGTAEGDCDGETSAPATAKAVARASEIIACSFMPSGQTITAPCRISPQTASRGTASKNEIRRLGRTSTATAPSGFSSRNLGDTLAGCLIACWEIVNNADASGNREGILRESSGSICRPRSGRRRFLDYFGW